VTALHFKFRHLTWLVPVLALVLVAPIVGRAQLGKPTQSTAQAAPRPGSPDQRGPVPSRLPGLGAWEWWKDDAVKKEMRLTDRQVAQITRLFEERVRQMTPHWEELQKELAALNKMAEEQTVDVATFSIQVLRVETLRSKLNETRSVMFYSIHRQLKPEQYEALKKIQDRRRSGRGDGRGGGR